MVTEVDIHPLIEELEFINYKKHWGATLRFGFLIIDEVDFRTIEEAMIMRSEGEV